MQRRVNRESRLWGSLGGKIHSLYRTVVIDKKLPTFVSKGYKSFNVCKRYRVLFIQRLLQEPGDKAACSQICKKALPLFQGPTLERHSCRWQHPCREGVLGAGSSPLHLRRGLYHLLRTAHLFWNLWLPACLLTRCKELMQSHPPSPPQCGLLTVRLYEKDELPRWNVPQQV